MRAFSARILNICRVVTRVQRPYNGRIKTPQSTRKTKQGRAKDKALKKRNETKNTSFHKSRLLIYTHFDHILKVYPVLWLNFSTDYFHGLKIKCEMMAGSN